MTTTQAKYDVVFTATHAWWEIRGKDFELADDYVEDALRETFTGEDAYLADCDESFACTVLSVDEEHAAIRKGDVVVSAGIGDDKVFLRLKK